MSIVQQFEQQVIQRHESQAVILSYDKRPKKHIPIRYGKVLEMLNLRIDLLKYLNEAP